MNLGARGERVAARFLKRARYRILTRNYRCPAGEIDIIAADGDMLVFVEVKTRCSNESADPEINVTHTKQRQIERVARYYVQSRSAHAQPCRFDVVSVVLPGRGEPVVEHFVDAFQASAR